MKHTPTTIAVSLRLMRKRDLRKPQQAAELLASRLTQGWAFLSYGKPEAEMVRVRQEHQAEVREIVRIALEVIPTL